MSTSTRLTIVANMIAICAWLAAACPGELGGPDPVNPDTAPTEDTEALCDDGLDNEGDGLTDCRDPGCQATLVCREETEASCQDGIDNDGDGAVDCDDPGCAGLLRCAPRESDCLNAVDDDGDGAVDCADTDCSPLPECGGFCYGVAFTSPAVWGEALTESSHDEDPQTACVQTTVRVLATDPLPDTQICLYLYGDGMTLLGCRDPLAANPVEVAGVTLCQGNNTLIARVKQGAITCSHVRIDVVTYENPTCTVTAPAGLSTDAAAPSLVAGTPLDLEVTTSGARVEILVDGAPLAGELVGVDGVARLSALSLGDGPGVSLVARCHGSPQGSGFTDSPTHFLWTGLTGP